LAGLAFAVGSAETGVGVGAGFAVAVHGEDVMISGFRSAWAGESLPGVTEKLLREGGLSAEDAAALDTLFSVAGTMGVSAASSLGRGGESGFRLTPSTGGAAALAVTPQGMAGARALLGAMESGAILFARKGSAPGEGVRPKLRGSGGGLPTRGRVRYVPPKWWRPSQQLPRGPQRGYLDRFGNEWVWNARQGHWDVQLSKHGVQQYAGFLGAGKRHMNVTAAGVLTH